MEAFYEDIIKAGEEDVYGCIYEIIIGDFNAAFGKMKIDGDGYVGEHGLGIINSRGERLTDVLAYQKLYAMNVFLKKKLKVNLHGSAQMDAQRMK